MAEKGRKGKNFIVEMKEKDEELNTTHDIVVIISHIKTNEKDVNNISYLWAARLVF